MVEVRCVLQARSVLGEGALWCARDKVLYWVDQMRPELHRFDPATGIDTKIDIDLPEQLGAVVPRRSGGLVLAASDGISFIDPAMRNRTAFCNPVRHQARACFNDAKCDRHGRLWAGTTDRQETERLGELYRFDPDGSCERVAGGFIASNGPSFSPDGTIMYHTRSHERLIYAYDVDREAGTASSERIFARYDVSDGIPDGSAVDSEGYLWSTHWAGWRVTRFAPDGRIERVIKMPVKTLTSCAFGGDDLATLYVTSASIEFADGKWIYMNDDGFTANPLAGAIFAIDVGVRGIAEPAFAG
ncbi:MAG: SMP-30/gluconolactonase/LRE family protein [bacterium]